MDRRLLLVLSGALGCGIPVKVGTLDDAGGTTGATLETGTDTGEVLESSTTQDSDTGVIERREYAIRHGDLPDVGTGSEDGGSSASGSDTGDGIDPDTLHVSITTGESTCEDPYGNIPCGDRWEVSIALPPELQTAGAAGSLDEVNGFFYETLELGGGGPDDCGQGGGTLEGSFEITSIDDSEVRGRLFDLGHGSDVIPTEIEFAAPRCG